MPTLQNEKMKIIGKLASCDRFSNPTRQVTKIIKKLASRDRTKLEFLLDLGCIS
jgi:hypothetical protein